MNGALNPKADVDGLYDRRKNGGREIHQIEAACENAIVRMRNYMESH